MREPACSGPEGVLALQRSLVAAVFMEDPEPLRRDPRGFAAAQGLDRRDQAAFAKFRHRLLNYREVIRGGLTEPIQDMFPICRALLDGAGLWETAMSAFLATRGVQSPFYRDIAPTFLGWLAATAWGQDRWPFLLQLAHCEILQALVVHHPGAGPQPGLHREPAPEDRLVLHPAAQVVTYGYAVHRATVAAPIPAEGTVHLLVHRRPDGSAQWQELTAATAALLVDGQRASLGSTARALGLPHMADAFRLLQTFQAQGAILGFRAPGEDPGARLEGR